MSTTSRIPSMNSRKSFSQNISNGRLLNRNVNSNYQELYSNACEQVTLYDNYNGNEHYDENTQNYTCDNYSESYDQYYPQSINHENIDQEENFRDTSLDAQGN